MPRARAGRLPCVAVLYGAHSFVDLTEGRCHYRIDGPEDGPWVLLVHGATVPGWQFDRLVPYLAKAGLRTVRADLYGHGYSARPHTRYVHELFVRQQVELLDALGIPGPVHALGHSLGASIVAQLALQHPARVARLALSAPLVDFTRRLPVTHVLRAPLLGELLMWGYVVPLLTRRRMRRYGALENGHYARLFDGQLRHPGFHRALLSLFRCGSLGDQRSHYEALRATPHPVLVLRGGDDTVVSRAQTESVLCALPRARYTEIADAPHSFLLTRPQDVAPALVPFLTGGP